MKKLRKIILALILVLLFSPTNQTFSAEKNSNPETVVAGLAQGLHHESVNYYDVKKFHLHSDLLTRYAVYGKLASGKQNFSLLLNERSPCTSKVQSEFFANGLNLKFNKKYSFEIWTVLASLPPCGKNKKDFMAGGWLGPKIDFENQNFSIDFNGGLVVIPDSRAKFVYGGVKFTY